MAILFIGYSIRNERLTVRDRANGLAGHLFAIGREARGGPSLQCGKMLSC